MHTSKSTKGAVAVCTSAMLYLIILFYPHYSYFSYVINICMLSVMCNQFCFFKEEEEVAKAETEEKIIDSNGDLVYVTAAKNIIEYCITFCYPTIFNLLLCCHFLINKIFKKVSSQHCRPCD